MRLFKSLVISLFIILLIIPPIILLCSRAIIESRNKRCKQNLKQIYFALCVYQHEYGHQYLPDTNGGGFLARPYQVGIIKDRQILVCPSSNDSILTDMALKELIAEDPEDKNIISYAGRKNADRKQYPGISSRIPEPSYMRTRKIFSIASDDWQGSPNHENGQCINFLLIWGECIEVKDLDVNGNDYEAYAKKGEQLADPLTN